MSHVIVECPGCLSRLKVRESREDIQLDCPRCNELILVEGISTAAPPSRPTPAPQRRPVAPPSPAARRPGTLASSSRPSRPAAAGRRREAESHADEDYETVYDQPTTSRPGRMPPARRSGRPQLSAEDRRAQTENRVFIGAIVAVVAVCVAGAAWYFGRNSGEAEVPLQVTDSPTPELTTPNGGMEAPAGPPPAATPNTFAGVAIPANPPAGDSALAQSPVPGAGSAGIAAAPGSDASGANPGTPQAPPAASIPPGSTNPSVTPPVAAVARDGRRLQYRWKTGAEHLYMVSITAGEGNGAYRVSGSCSYTVGGDASVPDDEGSGTGFAISADGFIATCAHVVDGAKSIEVVINQQTLPATIVAVDTKTDVAIIRINTAGLTPVQISDSDTVQLAESVRVIGFPLSDVLGTEAKITTGTVAGIVMDPEHGKRIQVDAPINPGNSGGPVVNDAGEVVGVASAKLAGSSVTSVGFAAPVNDLRNLMTAHRIPQTAVRRGTALSGPAVFQKVRPSVCFIKVRGSSGGRTATLNYSGSFTESQSFDPRSMRFGAFPRMPSHTADRGTVTVNGMGEVLSYTGEEHLPFVLGPIGMFFIERLDPYSETQWSHEETSSLHRIKRADRGPMGRGFGPPGMPRGPRGPRGFGADPFGRDQPDEVVDTIPAVERISYRAGQELNGRISLAKTYEFVTTRDPQKPYMKIRGNGTVVFDMNQGIPQSLEYQATLESNDEDGHSSFPLKVTYTLRDPDEVRKERELAAQRAKELKEEKQQNALVPNPQLVEALLEEVRKAEGGTQASQPLSKLAEIAVVEELRTKVLTVTRKHMKNSNGFVTKSAAEAFAHWATEKEFDELVAIVRNKDGLMYTAHKKVVATMATFNSPKVYPILIEAMHHSFVRTDAKNAMIAVGSPIEDLILDQFGSLTDAGVKRELMEVLQKVGTMKSEGFLEKLATGPDFSLRSGAQRALDAVRSR